MHELRINSQEETRNAKAEVRQTVSQVDTEVYPPHVLGHCAVAEIRGAHTVVGVDSRWMGRYCRIQRLSTC